MRIAVALLAGALAALAVAPAGAVTSGGHEITNGVITAELATSCTLTSISVGTSAPHPQPPQQQRIAEGGWSLEVGGVKHSAATLHASLEISQPSPSEVRCTWKAEPDSFTDGTGAGSAQVFTVSYAAQPGRSFVQKSLNVSCNGDCSIGQVTPITGLKVGEAGVETSQFSLDAGGVFIRQNTSAAGLMVVVQNKHMELNAPDGGGGSKLKWTVHKDMGYTCTASEYKGTVDPHAWHENHTASGCLADAIKMGQGINYATTPGPVNCYVCSVTDGIAKLHPLLGQITFVGTDPTASNHTSESSISLSYAAGLTAHPMVVPSPFQADLALFTPYEQTPDVIPWPKSAGGTGLQQAEYECFWSTVSEPMQRVQLALTSILM
jgi:hypothetical protein